MQKSRGFDACSQIAHTSEERMRTLGLLLFLALTTTGSAQDQCVYRIIVSGCQHEPNVRILTGFSLSTAPGIYTALHGVVDATRIGALNKRTGQAFSKLYISMVDVALLDSPELQGKSLPGLELGNFVDNVDPGRLWVLGYPLGIDLQPTKDLLLRSLTLVELQSLLQDNARQPVRDRGSPYFRSLVISIQGKFLPGHSGAPVLDSQNRVLGIANGGLQGGLADISWAIPLNKLQLKSASDEERDLDRLRSLNPSDVFFFEKVGPTPTPPIHELSEYEKQVFDYLANAVAVQKFDSNQDIWESGQKPFLIDHVKMRNMLSNSFQTIPNQTKRLEGGTWTWYWQLQNFRTAKAEANWHYSPNEASYTIEVIKDLPSLFEASEYARAAIKYAKTRSWTGDVSEYHDTGGTVVSSEFTNPLLGCGVEIRSGKTASSTPTGTVLFFFHKAIPLHQ
jgi:hypothetical protein